MVYVCTGEERSNGRKPERNATHFRKWSWSTFLFYCFSHIFHSLLFRNGDYFSARDKNMYSAPYNVGIWTRKNAKKIRRKRESAVPNPSRKDEECQARRVFPTPALPFVDQGSLPRHSRVSKSTLLRVSKILLELHELQKFAAELLEWHFTIEFRWANI